MSTDTRCYTPLLDLLVFRVSMDGGGIMESVVIDAANTGCICPPRLGCLVLVLFIHALIFRRQVCHERVVTKRIR